MILKFKDSGNCKRFANCAHKATLFLMFFSQFAVFAVGFYCLLKFFGIFNSFALNLMFISVMDLIIPVAPKRTVREKECAECEKSNRCQFSLQRFTDEKRGFLSAAFAFGISCAEALVLLLITYPITNIWICIGIVAVFDVIVFLSVKFIIDTFHGFVKDTEEN